MKICIIGNTDKGPKYDPIRIDPKTPAVKWWQFWKWHKIKEIDAKRTKECLREIYRLFGKPSSKETKTIIKILAESAVSGNQIYVKRSIAKSKRGKK